MDLPTLGFVVVLIGWIVTQVHLIRTAKSIERNIDAKRSETQTFVDERLRSLEANVGGFEARMTAQMPPNVDGRIADMEVALSGALDEIKAAVTQFNETKGKIEQIDAGLGNWTASVDSKLGAVFGTQGQANLALQKMAGEAGADIQDAMQGAMSDQSNPLVRQLYAQLMRPVSEKWSAAHPVESLVVQAGKAWIAQNVLPQLAGGEGAAAGVTRYGVSKGDKIL